MYESELMEILGEPEWHEVETADLEVIDWESWDRKYVIYDDHFCTSCPGYDVRYNAAGTGFPYLERVGKGECLQEAMEVVREHRKKCE